MKGILFGSSQENKFLVNLLLLLTSFFVHQGINKQIYLFSFPLPHQMHTNLNPISPSLLKFLIETKFENLDLSIQFFNVSIFFLILASPFLALVAWILNYVSYFSLILSVLRLRFLLCVSLAARPTIRFHFSENQRWATERRFCWRSSSLVTLGENDAPCWCCSFSQITFSFQCG